MAINTGGFAVPGSIPTLVGPTAPPVVFKYADGATLAPNSHPEGYAQGMLSAGQSLGQAIQQAAANLNPVAMAQRKAALAEAKNKEAQAGFLNRVYQGINQKIDSQNQAPTIPGAANTGPSTSMPKAQGNGLTGLQDPYSVTKADNATDIPGAGPFILNPFNMAESRPDQVYQESQLQKFHNTSLNADTLSSEYQNEPAIKNYSGIVSNYGMIDKIKQKIQKGDQLSTADTGSLLNAYSNVVNPDGAAKGVSPKDIIAASNLNDDIKTEFAHYFSSGSTIMSPELANQLIASGATGFANQTQLANGIRDSYKNRVKGTNLYNDNQINKNFPDKVSQYSGSLGLNKASSVIPERAKSINQQMQDIQTKNPTWSKQEVVAFWNANKEK